MERQRMWIAVACIAIIVIAAVFIFSYIRGQREGYVREVSVEAVQREIERIKNDPKIPAGVKENLLRQLQTELQRAQTKQPQSSPTAPSP